MEQTMRVSKVMTRDVETMSPDHSIEDAARMMLALDSGFLPVGEADRLVGTITDRDIAVRAVAEGKDPSTKVSEIMTHDVRYCFEDEDTAHVAKNMGEQQVRRLPVVDRNKRLVGIISLADIAREEADPRKAGSAYSGITRPGGQHTQQDGFAR
jgi:CBS domain-containing protein